MPSFRALPGPTPSGGGPRGPRRPSGQTGRLGRGPTRAAGPAGFLTLFRLWSLVLAGARALGRLCPRAHRSADFTAQAQAGRWSRREPGALPLAGWGARASQLASWNLLLTSAPGWRGALSMEVRGRVPEPLASDVSGCHQRYFPVSCGPEGRGHFVRRNKPNNNHTHPCTIFRSFL